MTRARISIAPRRSVALYALLAIVMMIASYVVIVLLAAACVYLPYVILAGIETANLQVLILFLGGIAAAAAMLWSLVPQPEKFQRNGPMCGGSEMRKFVPCAVAVIVAGCGTLLAQNTPRPTQEELAAITERGRMLYEYDQAAWHATDAAQTANPKNVEGQRYIAKKENGKWTVVFGKLNEDSTRFAITFEADEQATLRQFAVQREPEGREDEGFFLYAARAIETAMKDFGGAGRPYNVAVLPGPTEQLYVYLYPAQTKARVYPLGGDVRYLVNADGTMILEKRQMHKTIIEAGPLPGKKVVSGVHTHVLSDLPEDTDVFHVLTQDPSIPEFIGTANFLYEVKADGTIQIKKEMKRK